MHLKAYRLKNFRRLRDVVVELAPEISIFVGANNSGKTSATQVIQMFLAGEKSRLSLYDFSSQVWTALNNLGAANPAGDATASIPSIVLDLWFEVAAPDLRLVLSILPSFEQQRTEVGVRIEFKAMNSLLLLQRFRERKAHGAVRAAALPGGAGDYVPWPKTLSDYLQKELEREFEFRYFVLDRAQFDGDYKAVAGYVPTELNGEPGGKAILSSLVRVDCLNAQRHLADPEGTTGGRAEDLSRRLSRFYKRNLNQHEEDHTALKALFESEVGLNKHLSKVFEDTLKSLAELGYPGLSNPRLEITSGLNPATVMKQDAKVNYILGEGATAVRLPDTYNGLGFKNLIYIVVEILDSQAKWMAEDNRPPLHLIFIEEPEAHLHGQLQQVFIRNVLSLLEVPKDADGPFRSQTVITTHSPHILYEGGFAPIRYFRRHAEEGEQSTTVLNLSRFQPGTAPKDRNFLQRYLKLTHCDLFFADAVILVEGNVERLLMPVMIEKAAKSLRSSCLCILEVGGAFCHRFKALIEFLGVTTLVITDVDSVSPVAAPDADNEDEEKEFELPAAVEGGAPEKQYGSTCQPLLQGAVTANQTLIQWIPKKRTIAELLLVAAVDKVQPIAGSEPAKVRVAYQVSTTINWLGTNSAQAGRTLEEAFGLENTAWCQAAAQKSMGLKLKTAPATADALAKGLHLRVIGRNFDKTKFALGVLSRSADDWVVPLYIKEGLEWLKEQVDLEKEEEPAPAIGGPAASSPVPVVVQQ